MKTRCSARIYWPSKIKERGKQGKKWPTYPIQASVIRQQYTISEICGELGLISVVKLLINGPLLSKG